jgi:hypothetical protein
MYADRGILAYRLFKTCCVQTVEKLENPHCSPTLEIFAGRDVRL